MVEEFEGLKGSVFSIWCSVFGLWLKEDLLIVNSEFVLVLIHQNPAG